MKIYELGLMSGSEVAGQRSSAVKAGININFLTGAFLIHGLP